MESFAFELKLVDSVSASAKKATDSARQFETQAKKTQAALDFSKELEKTETQLKRLKVDPAGFQRLVSAQKELAERRKELGKDTFADGLKEGFSFEKMTSAAFLGTLLAESLIEGAKKAVEFITEGIKMAFEAGSKAETSRIGFELSLGKGEAESTLEDIERFSKLTGLTSSQIEPMMLQQRRSGMSEDAARQNMAMALDASAGMGKGGDTGTINGIIEGLTSITRRGGITKKQLNGLGVSDQSIPDFYKALGKSLHVSAKQAEKMAEEGGKVDPQLIRNIIGKSIEKQQGGELGTGAERFSHSMEARLNKLKSLPEEYFREISKSDSWNKLSDKFGEFLTKLDPKSPEGQRIMGSLFGVFEKLEGLVEDLLKPESIDAFVSGLKDAADAAKSLLSVFAGIVDAIRKIDKFDEFLANAFIPDQSDPSGKLHKIDRLRKEINTGQLTKTEREQRERDIESTKKSFTPSERADYQAATKTVAPAAANTGKALVSMNVQNVIHMRHEGDDDEKARKAAQHVEKHVAHAMEKATGHS